MSVLQDLPAAQAAAFADLEVGLVWGSTHDDSVDGARLVGDDDADSVDMLTPRAAIAALRAVEVQLARLHALQARLLVAAADARPHVAEYTVLLPGDDPADSRERVIRIQDAVREEIAAALRWSPVTAQYRIDAARLLAGPLANTAAALAVGVITPAHARVIVESAESLPGRWMRDSLETAQFQSACSALQERVLPVAAGGTLSRTRTAAVRAVLAIDPQGAGRRRASALRTKDVTVTDDVEGMSGLHARLGSEQAHAILQKVLAHADSLPAVDTADHELRETAGQRRARALVDLLLGSALDGSGGPGLPTRSGARMQAQVDVTIDLPTLLALRTVLDDSDPGVAGSHDDPAASHAGAEDGSFERTEHIALLAQRVAVHPHVVRDLLADPDVAVTLRRLVTEPLTGALLDLGRTTYAIPARLRDFLAVRDRTCRFPGCRQPARRCQVDHIRAWDEGGATDPENLHLLCPRHHQLKTHGGWTPSRDADGSTTWLSPQGSEYRVAPEGRAAPPFRQTPRGSVDP